MAVFRSTSSVVSSPVALDSGASAWSSLSRLWPSSGAKRHSLASVDVGGWSSRPPHRRGSTLPISFCSSLGPVEASRRLEALEGVQTAIIQLFQRNTLKENELGTLQETMRSLADADAGNAIYECYKEQLLRKGMVILREKMKNDQGEELVEKLGETWDYFFTQILPTLQAIMYPVSDPSKDMDIRNTTLLEFRNIVVLKVGLKETVDSKKYEIPASIRQMLLILQGLHDPTFLSKEQYDLEKLVACVVVPFLGSRGLYQGGPEPVTKASYRPTLSLGPRAKPKVTITVSDAAAYEERSRDRKAVNNNNYNNNNSSTTTSSAMTTSNSMGSIARSPRLGALACRLGGGRLGDPSHSSQHPHSASPSSPMRKLHLQTVGGGPGPGTGGVGPSGVLPGGGPGVVASGGVVGGAGGASGGSGVHLAIPEQTSSSHGVLGSSSSSSSNRLKPVLEVLDAGRRHSIVGT